MNNIPKNQPSTPNKIDTWELFAAIAHEAKNKLVLLSGNLGSIPFINEDFHDKHLKEAQILVQRISWELTQALILHGADISGHMYLNAIDGYSPHEFVADLARIAIELAPNNLVINAHAEEDLPLVWFFDRNLLQ